MSCRLTQPKVSTPWIKLWERVDSSFQSSISYCLFFSDAKNISCVCILVFISCYIFFKYISDFLKVSCSTTLGFIPTENMEVFTIDFFCVLSKDNSIFPTFGWQYVWVCMCIHVCMYACVCIMWPAKNKLLQGADRQKSTRERKRTRYNPGVKILQG